MNGLAVARVLVLTRLRRILGDQDRRRAQLIALIGFGPILYHLAQMGSGTTVEGLVGYGGLLPSLMLGLAVMQVFRTVQQFGSFAGMEQLVPFATLRGTVTGFVIADAVTVLALLLVPLSAFLIPFMAATGMVLVPVPVVLGLAAVVFSATVVGTVLGMAVRWLIALFPGRHRFMLRVLALIAMFVVIDRVAQAWFGPGSFAVADGLGVRAMETMLAPVTGTMVHPTGLVFLLLPLLISLPLSWPLAWLTERVWLFDPSSEESHRTGGSGFSVDGVRLYARVLWMRGLRSPERLSHLLIAVFMLFPVGGAVLAAPWLVGFIVLFLGVWLTGASFGLNPIGDDVDQLPMLMLVDLDPEEMLWGRLVAGLVPGLALIGAGTVIGIVGGVPVALMVAAASASIMLAVSMTAVGLGLGAASPRFDAVQRYGGLRARTPTTLPMIGHIFACQVAFVLMMVVVFFPSVFELAPVLAPLKTGVVRVIVLTVLGAGIAGAGGAGWWFARDRLRGYEVG